MAGRFLMFILASASLLGSPGPGIAALLSVGKSQGLSGGLRYLAVMQLGLAVSAAVSAAGLAALLRASPILHVALTALSLAYLAWLAWSIATAPLSGGVGESLPRRHSLWGAFLLGAANPKAYFAFAALFGSFTLMAPDYGLADQAAKWTVALIVAMVVDCGWLVAGAGLGRIALRPQAERMMNIAMGAAILLAAMLAVM